MRIENFIVASAVGGMLICSCVREVPLKDVSLHPSLADVVEGRQEELISEDVIPDFSTVGYRNSDFPYPDYPVMETVSVEAVAEALSKGVYADTTSFIQAAIDRAAASSSGATVLLKDGIYNIGGVLFIDKGKVILRGESRENTVIMLTDTLQKPGIVVGTTVAYSDKPSETVRAFSGRKFELEKLAVDYPGSGEYGGYYLYKWVPAMLTASIFSRVAVAEPYCPVGRFTVIVDDPTPFSVGSDVVVERPHSNYWISDIGMDKIASNGRSYRPVVQWNNRNLTMTWTRKVTAIEGNRISFDAPLVQSLDTEYGGGSVGLYTLERISGCGVENLTIDSVYDPSIRTSSGDYMDEKHAWYGVVFTSAEDCFARGVSARHIGYVAVQLMSGSRCITVEDCSYEAPVSYPSSSRRYGFSIEGADLCLFKNCYCEKAAIGFATNAKGGGPNAFVSCRGADMNTGAGPHQSWSTGTLYDCCTNTAGFRCTDHGNSGTGHGWCGANNIFWNVETEGKIECESPWAAENTPDMTFHSRHASARNYCVGAVCARRVQCVLHFDYYGNRVDDYYESLGYTRRPDAQWYPYVDYDQGGSAHVQLPDTDAVSRFSWWPRFTINTFSNPFSLYECQLEERRASVKK